MERRSARTREPLLTPRNILILGAVVMIGSLVWLGMVSASASPKKAAPPAKHPTHLGHVGCLHPVGTKVSLRLPVSTPAPTITLTPTQSLHRLLAERQTPTWVAISGSVIEWSPSGRRFLFSETGHTLAIGDRLTHNLTVLPVRSYEDVAFSGSGAQIIYEKRPQFTPYRCAATVLMETGLGGRGKRLLYAGPYRLLNTSPGPNGACCNNALQEDVLGNGWIGLVRGQTPLVLDTKRHRIDALRLHTRPLVSAGILARRVVLSPDGRYAAIEGATSSSVTVNPSPTGGPILVENARTGHVLYRLTGSDAAWSPSGDRLAYQTTRVTTAFRQGFATISTLDLSTRARATFGAWTRATGRLNAGFRQWSRDGSYLTFTGGVLGANGQKCIPALFVSSWQGKHLLVLNSPRPVSGASTGSCRSRH